MYLILFGLNLWLFQHINQIPNVHLHMYIQTHCMLPPPQLIVHIHNYIYIYIHMCICLPPALKAQFANSCSKTLYSLHTLAAANEESHVMKEGKAIFNESSKHFTNTSRHVRSASSQPTLQRAAPPLPPLPQLLMQRPTNE